MNTRMDKYTEIPSLKSRVVKNKDLYEHIKSSDIDRYDIDSNATVISEDVNNLNVDDVRNILDKKYKEDIYIEKNRLERSNTSYNDKEISNTKEYDINNILEEARKNQKFDYEKERLKKIHDTQYDILKNLDIDKKDDVIEETEENIVNLINTITHLEMKFDKENGGNTTALDLLSDLSDNDTETVYKTMELDKEKISEKSLNNLDEEDISIENKFDDFKELEKDLKSNNIAIKLVGIILLLIVLAFIVIFVNKYFNLGLF